VVRNEDWLLIYLAFVAVVIGCWLYDRHNKARLLEVNERAARLIPAIPRPRHSVDDRPAGCTVYWSKEAIKGDIIAEYESSRPTVIQPRPDHDELARVWSMARRVGQNDRAFTADLILQGHEPHVSRDLDVECYPVLSNVTKLRQDSGL